MTCSVEVIQANPASAPARRSYDPVGLELRRQQLCASMTIGDLSTLAVWSIKGRELVEGGESWHQIAHLLTCGKSTNIS